MKKIILAIIVIGVIGLIAWGIWFFVFSKDSGQDIFSGSGSLPPVSLRSVQSQTQSGSSVRVRDVSSPQNPAVAEDFLSQTQDADQIALGGTVVASPYAIQIWGDENGGGEALLKYELTKWILVSFGGGEWSVLGLMQEGVPVALAKQLITGLTNGKSPIVAPSVNIPDGDMVTIGTSDGSIEMKNFYRSAEYIDQDQRSVVIKQTPVYSIIYNISNSSFAVAVVGMPFEPARQTAEAAFWDSLGISQRDACKLNVWVFKPGQASNARLSFCTN